jgi:hypothetical protein
LFVPRRPKRGPEITSNRSFLLHVILRLPTKKKLFWVMKKNKGLSTTPAFHGIVVLVLHECLLLFWLHNVHVIGSFLSCSTLISFVSHFHPMATGQWQRLWKHWRASKDLFALKPLQFLSIPVIAAVSNVSRVF